MKKEDLIIKWLDHSLEEKELKAFEKLDASSAYKKIDQAIEKFKAPDFNSKEVYSKIQDHTLAQRQMYPWKRMMASVAAVLVVCLGVYFSYFNDQPDTFFAQNSELINLQLPDESRIVLNAGSEVSYDEDSWNALRTLELKGEAFFDVKKGSTFTVQTSQGIITVLGTEFNVKSRENFFEVTCYEGLVEVTFKNEKILLPAGNGFRAFLNQTENQQTSDLKPSWVEKRSSFKSAPFQEIIEELERQFNITVNYDGAENATLFTTSFTHKNLEAALQAITIPLKLSYQIEGNNVMLKSIGSD